MSSLLIKNGYLLDLNRPLVRGDVLVDDNLITRVADHIGEAADRVIDATDKVVMPGLINAHNHSHQALLKGLTDNLPLEPWLIYAVHSGRDMSPRELYVSAAVGAMELMKTGTTAVIDNPGFNTFELVPRTEAIIQAYIDVGMRAVVAPITDDMDIYSSYPFHLLPDLDKPPRLDRTAPNLGDLEPQLRDLLGRWPAGRHPLISLFISPSGPNRSTREFMELTAALAAQYGVGLHTHLLETKAELLSGWQMFSQGTVSFLRDVGWLSPRSSFAHGVWLDRQEMAILADAGCTVVHNPISNLKLGSGIAPVQMMRQAGLNVALGSDDASCSDSANMMEVTKYAGLLHKLHGQCSDWVGGRDALEMNLRGGARASGQQIGALEAGYLADLLILDMETLYLMPKKQFIDQLVFSESGRSVETVIVDGQVVIEGRKMVHVDEQALMAEAREIVRKTYADLSSRETALGAHAGLLERMRRAVEEYPLGFTRVLGSDYC